VTYKSNKINSEDNMWKELHINLPKGKADDQREKWLTQPNVIDNGTLRICYFLPNEMDTEMKKKTIQKLVQKLYQACA
jgi:hypothetical protein